MKITLTTVTALAAMTTFSACSNLPRTKDFDNLSSSMKDMHSYVKNEQKKADNGKYTRTVASVDRVNKKTSASECYRITEGAAQWGLIEPEQIYLGESVTDSSSKAFIFVAPMLENGHFPTPPDESGYKSFRIDQDTPHSAKLVALLNSLLGRDDLCVKLMRGPLDDETEGEVLAALTMTKAAALASPVQEKVQEKAPEKAPEKAADPKAAEAPAVPAVPVAPAPAAVAPAAPSADDAAFEAVKKKKPAKKQSTDSGE